MRTPCVQAHKLKTDRTSFARALGEVRTRRKVLLTGTPLQNNLKEYFHMVNVCKPGYLGSADHFERLYTGTILGGAVKAETGAASRSAKSAMSKRIHVLAKKLDTLVHRRGVDIMQPDLPPKHEFVLTVRLSHVQRSLYNAWLALHPPPGAANTSAQNGPSAPAASGADAGGDAAAGATAAPPGVEPRKRSLLAVQKELMRVYNHPGILRLQMDKAASMQPAAEITDGGAATGVSADGGGADGGGDEGEEGRGLDGGEGGGECIEGADTRWWTHVWPDGASAPLDGALALTLGGKAALALDIIASAVRADEKTILFSGSLKTLDLLEEVLRRRRAASPRPFPRSAPCASITRPPTLRRRPTPRLDASGSWRKGLDYLRLDGTINSSEARQVATNLPS